MHGKIESVTLGKRYTRDEFVQLTPAMRRLYILNLISKYGARRKDVANYLGMSYPAIVQMCRKIFDENPFQNEGKGAKPTQAWLDFINQPTDFSDDEEKMEDFANLSKEEFLDSYSYLTEEEYDLTAEKTGINKQAVKEEPVVTTASLESVTIMLSGTPADLLGTLGKLLFLLDEGKSYHAKLIVDELIPVQPALSNL